LVHLSIFINSDWNVFFNFSFQNFIG
jgi:hypothetical protein